MRILVVGDGHSEIHEVAVAAAFRRLGHCVDTFYWHEYFKTGNRVGQQWLKAQHKFIVGPRISRVNADLVAKATLFRPELVFIYRGTHVTGSAILQIKAQMPKCLVFGYNNDDPFAAGHPPSLWRHFLTAIPMYDVSFAYRKRNISDFYSAGAKRVELLMPWFLPDADEPVD